jgi:hypothetical protein
VRYWFDADTETPDTPVCNSAWVLGCPAIILRYAAVTPPRVGATHYLEIGFATSAPMLDAGAQTDAIVASFHNLSWATVNRANDYSHDATKTVLADWNRVTLYHDGDLVWGVEPQP